jgi:hypothetical protein
MANHNNIVPFFYKWEGGKSSDVKDSASSYNCGEEWKRRNWKRLTSLTIGVTFH